MEMNICYVNELTNYQSKVRNQQRIRKRYKQAPHQISIYSALLDCNQTVNIAHFEYSGSLADIVLSLNPVPNQFEPCLF